MINREVMLREMVELLKVWAKIDDMYGPGGWSKATDALKDRINEIGDQLGYGSSHNDDLPF